MTPFKDVDEYIAGAPKEVQGKLKELRAAIKSVAPDVLEKISYGMPYYGYKGRLVYFAYFKDHISLFAMPPIPEEYKIKLKNNITGKATIRFALDEKLPLELIRELVRARVKKNEAKKTN